VVDFHSMLLIESGLALIAMPLAFACPELVQASLVVLRPLAKFARGTAVLALGLSALVLRAACCRFLRPMSTVNNGLRKMIWAQNKIRN
jgi:hypothetical protein